MNTSSSGNDIAYAMSRIEIPTTFPQNSSKAASFEKKLQNSQLTPNSVLEHISTHSAMLKLSVIGSISALPISYTQYHSPNLTLSVNASGQSGAGLIGYYDNIEKQLDALLNDDEDAIERDAVSSARKVLAYIRKYELPPPMISSHGGDAVVMLWVLGDTTSAITITNGQLGYVVRRDRKLVQMAHSLAIDKYLVGRELKLL